MKFNYLFICVLAIFFSGFVNAKQLQTVPNLDLQKYQGKWFEIARFPNKFQTQCLKNVTAEYRLLEDGKIEVINRCIKEKGIEDYVKGVARKQSPDTNSKLEVSFFSLFGWRPAWGAYWVFYIDPEYQMAVVGDGKQKYGWILARSKQLTQVQLDKAKDVFEQNGYQAKQLIFTQHD